MTTFAALNQQPTEDEMKISGIQIKNFRGIKDLSLDSLGNLNVFVGKNNSGKSTILAAIDSLFKIANQSIVSNYFTQKDFHSNNYTTPISISGSFEFDRSFLDVIFHKMKEEHPQVLSAIDDLSKLSTINIYTTTIKTFENDPVSFVEKITLSTICPFSEKNITEKIILRTGITVAQELLSESTKIKELRDKAEELKASLDTIDPDDYRVARERGIPPRMKMASAMRKSPIVQDLVYSTQDYHDFRNRLREEIDACNIERDSIRKSETRSEISLISGRTRQIPEYILDLLKHINDTRILHEQERKKPIDKDDAEQLLDLKVTRGGPERLVQLQGIVQSLLGVRLEAFKGTDHNSKAEIDIDDFLVDMNGAGIRESLRLVLDLEFKKPEIVLIEEPEVHLHYGLERKLFNHLINIAKDKQIFLTTHSTGFVDTSEANNVFLVRKNETTEASKLSNTDLTDMLSELGISVSSLLLAKALIFVEGPSDEFIIRGYFDSVHPELSYADIGFVKMGGVGNYRYYANSSALEILSNRGLETTFIIDSDSLSENEKSKIISQHPKNSSIHILPTRCIENLFLNPNTIIEFLKRKGSNINIIIPNIDEMQNLIDSKAELLFPETVRLFLSWRYMKPIYPSSTYSSHEGITSVDEAVSWVKLGIENSLIAGDSSVDNFSNTYQQEVENIEIEWKNRKLEIVPGDKLIDLICRDFDLRYKKTQSDGDMLSQATPVENWPKHLIELLDGIANRAKSSEKTIFD